jgi:NAD(P)-dependent dehydrogenase (short-subunit alcohol dehydrogenase family)
MAPLPTASPHKTRALNPPPPVVLACRSRAKGEALAKRLAAEAAAAGCTAPSLEVMLLDLDSLESARAFVAEWERTKRPLHVLINNAGVFNMGGAWHRAAAGPRRAAGSRRGAGGGRRGRCVCARRRR